MVAPDRQSAGPRACRRAPRVGEGGGNGGAEYGDEVLNRKHD